jgi:hypothetical protein
MDLREIGCEDGKQTELAQVFSISDIKVLVLLPEC